MDTVTVAEARKNFSELMAQVAYTHKRILVERRGKPMMALVSVEDLQRLEAWVDDKEVRHAQAFTALEMATQFRQQMAQKGIIFPDSVEEINRQREERVYELSSLR
ncbi:MAG: type II toxin-antitoxin system Phd/YefM family antitoxin [Chloroflexota bacterium]|nr:type II toxin-antitoxin system Phd/YefM family antitoxin [Chloroflexota bacterium]